MAKSPFVKSLVVATFVATTFWLFWPSDPRQTLNQLPAVAVVNKAAVKNPVLKNNKQQEDVAIKIADIAASAPAALVATAYAEELSYPPYSQPLNVTDFDRLNPNHYNPQSIPVNDSGASISAALSKYRYTYPEPIVAKLSGDNINNALLKLVELDTGSTLKSEDFKYIDGQWQTSISGERDYPAQIQATAIVEVDNKLVSLALSLKYIDSVASLDSFDTAIAKGADMVVTANLSVREKGMYRIMGNLFDDNDQPIAHVVAKQRLKKGQQSMELKVHQSVLQGQEPPFYLTTFNVELMSPSPGVAKKYGSSLVKKHIIDDFSIASLENTPYQPTENELQRLQLLKNMADSQ